MNKINFGYFYSAGSPYKEISKQYLVNSLDKLNISNIYCEQTQNFGSWSRNVAEKPLAVLNILKKIDYGECLIFLDADSEVLSYPVLFEEIPEEFDLAAHYLSWEDWYGYKGNTTKEFLSGTLFIRKNIRTVTICEEWHKRAILTSEWEQKILGELIEESKVKVFHLPIEYCWIKSRPGGLPPLVKCDSPVILHHQLSRELKRSIK